MADPFSIAAGVIAVIGASRKTFQGLQRVCELRHKDEEFSELLTEVKSLQAQLQAVETSLQQFTQNQLSNELLEYCIRSVAIQSLEAKSVLGGIDKFLRNVEHKDTARDPASDRNPSTTKWLRRRSTLIRLTTRVRPIVHSLTAAAGILRAVASDQTLNRLEDLLTRLTVQNVELLQKTGMNSAAAKMNMVLDTKLNLSINKAIELERSTDQKENSIPLAVGQYSRRSSIDSYHPANSSSSDFTETLVSITGTMGAEICEPFCPCQCHISSQMRTPYWLRRILGTVTFHGNGSMLLARRPCNKNCRRSGPTAIQFSYLAPTWTLFKTLNVVVKAQCIHDLDFNIRMPRVIPYNATVWSLIELGKLPNLKEMVKQNATSPFDINPSGQSLLNYAAIHGQNEVYLFLLSMNADPDFRDASGIAANQPGVDRALSGTDLDRNVNGTGRANSYDLYINAKSLDQQGFNFLHLIILGLRHLDLEMVLAQCLSHENDVDAPDINGRTPLIWAAWRGDAKSVDLLISSRASIDRTDHEGYSAISRAAKSGHIDCVRRLLKAGALINVCDEHGLQPIHRASSNKANGLVVVDELLAWGANPNAPSASGTPLHFASNCGSLDTVKRLLLGGAEIDAQDPDGDSPAMVALLCWNQSIFSYLMHAGAKLNHVRKTGENILHLVTWAGSTEIWSELSTYANSEQTSGLDVKVPHNGHDLMHCFDHCRNLWYVGEREAMDDEVVKFRHLIYTFDDKLKLDV